jgi:hypothetical protein
MKKCLIILLFLGIGLSLVPASADSWDDFNDLDKAWDGQKTITNKEFEDTINALEAKKKQSEAKQRKKKIKKISGGGTSLHNELDPDKDIHEVQELKPDTEGELVNVPVRLILGDNVLEKGFYKVLSRRDENKRVYLMFYQSQFFKGEILATETNDDFDEETLNFTKLTPYNNSFMKIIYGSLDFNGYAFIPYMSED